MSLTLLRYRVWCSTDSKWEYWWIAEGDAAPTTCPTDTGHTVDSAKTTIVEIQATNEFETKPQVGGMKTDADGIEITAGASAMAEACYALGEDYHIQGVTLTWQGCKFGDYGWLAVLLPAAEGVLGAQANAAQADVTVAAGKGPYFAAASYLEIWTAGSELKEVVKIASVAGDVVTLASNLSATYDATHVAKARVDGFAPVRGTTGLDGGFKLLGAGTVNFENRQGVTEKIPAGTELCLRLFTSVVTGTREAVMNFRFRKPLA